MKNKPVVAVTRPNKLFDLTRLFFRISIMIAGGKVIFLTPKHSVSIDDYDGLILSGGTDIEPMRYGEPLDDIVEYDVCRDNFEFKILQDTVHAKKPILGICRGMQLINIYFGGTLFTDLKRVFDNLYLPTSFIAKAFYRKPVRVQGRNFLNTQSKTTTLRVNSIHHQSVNDLGQGGRVIATDDNDLVQAIDYKNHMILGVQWHPEYLIFDKKQRQIFKSFINLLN